MSRSVKHLFCRPPGNMPLSAFPSQTQQASEFPVRSRVTSAIDETRLVQLPGNVRPLPYGTFDLGRLDSARSSSAWFWYSSVARSRKRRYDSSMSASTIPSLPTSITGYMPTTFGRLYGPSDDDLAAVTSWLQNYGFTIYSIAKGRVTIEFSGTVAQVESAFHVEMHRYLVNGIEHIANNRDPEIPEALSPVVIGIASLHDFFDKPQIMLGNYVKRDPQTGKITVVAPPSSVGLNANKIALPQKNGAAPQLTYTDSSGDIHEDLTPYDFATIYNILPLWTASSPINGKGSKIAISGVSVLPPPMFLPFANPLDCLY